MTTTLHLTSCFTRYRFPLLPPSTPGHHRLSWGSCNFPLTSCSSAAAAALSSWPELSTVPDPLHSHNCCALCTLLTRCVQSSALLLSVFPRFHFMHLDQIVRRASKAGAVSAGGAVCRGVFSSGDGCFRAQPIAASIPLPGMAWWW
jgi:hypothetical protein